MGSSSAIHLHMVPSGMVLWGIVLSGMVLPGMVLSGTDLHGMDQGWSFLPPRPGISHSYMSIPELPAVN